MLGKTSQNIEANEGGDRQSKLCLKVDLIKAITSKKPSGILVRKQPALRGGAWIRGASQTANYLPVDKVENGVITTKDRRYIKIIEIAPVNFLLRSSREQKNIIYSFVSYLKISPAKVQIKVLTRQADTNKHLRNIHEDILREKDEKCRELQIDYEKLVRRLGSREAITRRFFLIFEYEPFLSGARPKNDESEAAAQLETAARTARTYLAQCGNEVYAHDNEDEFIAETLYCLLNRKSSGTIGFPGRINETIKRYAENFGPGAVNDIPVAEFAAPKSIDFSHAKYVKMDGVYHAYMLIPSNGYKPRVLSGWTSLLVNAGIFSLQ